MFPLTSFPFRVHPHLSLSSSLSLYNFRNNWLTTSTSLFTYSNLIFMHRIFLAPIYQRHLTFLSSAFYSGPVGRGCLPAEGKKTGSIVGEGGCYAKNCHMMLNLHACSRISPRRCYNPFEEAMVSMRPTKAFTRVKDEVLFHAG